MRVAVYLPLVLPLLAAVSARWLAGRLHPRVATWLLTAAALGLALATGLALTALAATAVAQIPLVAALGDWSVVVLRRDDPASLTLALIAGLLLVAALAAAGRAVLRRIHALVDATRTARRLPTADSAGMIVVVDDPCPDAYALPGVPGRIVVSTGMLDALELRERQALLAHERAHLVCAHHIFVALATLAAATNPLLRPLAAAVVYCTERWADEHAAAAVGNRRIVAHAIGKAALLTRNHPTPPGTLAIANNLGDGPIRAMTKAMTGAVLGALAPPGGRALDAFRRAGPVPRRVAALLAAPPRHQRVLLVVALGVLALGALSTLDAIRDLHALFELAEIGQS